MAAKRKPLKKRNTPRKREGRGKRVGRVGKSRYSRVIVFTDRQLLMAGIKPPFPDDQGTYEDPGLVIAGGRVPPLPQNVDCPGSLVIYSSWAEVVPNCNGFAGPAAGNNAVVARALQNADAVAARIPCADDCQKNVFEIWRGWNCGGNPRPIVATGAVEVKIECTITM